VLTIRETLASSLALENRALVEAARELAQGPFRERAAMVDRENRFPFENYADLHKSGVLAINVPKDFGGKGADAATYLAVQSEIAQGCASTALTFNMHCAIVDFLGQIASPAQQQRYFGEVVNDGAVIASITNEPASSFRDVFSLKTRIEREGDGYRLTGRKGWCSLSTGASYYFTWSRLPDSKDLSDGLLNVMVPAGREGVEIIEDWDSLGMRATASNSIDFKGVRIEQDEVIGAPGVLLTKDLSFWSMGYAAVYLGVAEAAFAFVRDHAAKAIEREGDSSAEALRLHRQIGEIAVELETARRAVLALVQSPEDADKSWLLNHAKYQGCEAANGVARKAMRVLGGSGLSHALPMQRYLRDSFAGLVMPPADDRCVETIGRMALGLEAKTVAFR